MRGTLDPVCPTGHYDPLASREVASDLAGDVLAIRRRRPSTRDRHQIRGRPGKERRRTARPQQRRGTVAEIVQRLRPVRVARHQRRDPGLFDAAHPFGQILESARQREAIAPDLRVYAIQPRHRPVVVEQADCLASTCAGKDTAGDGVVGFGQDRQQHPRAALISCQISDAGHDVASFSVR